MVILLIRKRGMTEEETKRGAKIRLNLFSTMYLEAKF
jgi:hypothetical protein